MKLYDWSFAPNPRRVKIFLLEKGIAGVTIEDVGGPNLTLKPEFMKRFEPYATAPTLELDDGTCLSEGMAICRYFEDLHPEPRLMGGDALDKATIEMWERRAYEGAMLAIGELLRNTTPEFVDRGLPGTTETISQVPNLVDRGRGRLARFAASANQRLADHPFLAGRAFSVADITAYCAVEFLERAMKVPVANDLPHLRRWLDGVGERSSVMATV